MPPIILYHYTDVSGLLGILKSGHFWASSIHHQNDSEEFAYGATLLKDLLPSVAEPDDSLDRGIRTAFRQPDRYSVFVASLSELGDDLGQWRAYAGNGAGVAIGLQYLPLRASLLRLGHHLRPCIYDPSHQQHLLLRFLTAMQRLVVQKSLSAMDVIVEFVPPLLRLLPRLKHPAFAAEREWRIVCEGSGAIPTVQVRASGSMLIPFYECDIRTGGVLPLSSVRLGPTTRADLLAVGVKRLLEAHRFFMEPLRSGVPFRTW
jgi:hypothetical protein